MINPPYIPGFFFDVEKEKYFPIKMKASYDAYMKRKSEELEKSISNADVKVKLAMSPQDLVQVWASVPAEFDSILQRIDRMNVFEIQWPEPIKIDADKGIYYRYFYEQGYNTVQHVIPSQNDCELVVKEFKHMCPDLMIDFGVIPVKADDEFNREFLYWFIKGKKMDKSSDEYCDFNQDLDIFIPKTFLHKYISYEANRVHIMNNNNVTTHFKVCSSVIEDSHGCNVIVSDENDCLVFRGRKRERQGLFTEYFDGRYSEQFNIPKNLDFICRVPELGFAHVSLGGLIQIKHQSVPSAGLKLKNSSATWLHYYSHNLYALTYHGDLVRFNLQQMASQTELFNVKDLRQLPWSLFSFEDLIIEAAKAVLLVCFRGDKDILVINLNNPTKVVKKIALKYKIQSIKLSSNCTNLYFHYISK